MAVGAMNLKAITSWRMSMRRHYLKACSNRPPIWSIGPLQVPAAPLVPEQLEQVSESVVEVVDDFPRGGYRQIDTIELRGQLGAHPLDSLELLQGVRTGSSIKTRISSATP